MHVCFVLVLPCGCACEVKLVSLFVGQQWWNPRLCFAQTTEFRLVLIEALDMLVFLYVGVKVHTKPASSSYFHDLPFVARNR